MENIVLVIPKDECDPYVFTSKLALRTWMEKKNFKFAIKSKNSILDKNDKEVYTVKYIFAYNSKEIKDGFMV